MNQTKSASQRQALKLILAKSMSKAQARQALLGSTHVTAQLTIVEGAEEGEEFLCNGKPISETAFLRISRAQMRAEGEGNGKITVLD